MKKKMKMQLIVASMLLVHIASAQPTNGTTPSIVRLDKRMDKLVPLDAKLEQIADGISWAEGPVWNRKEKYLLFSDVPNNSILKWTRAEGVITFRKPSGYTGATMFTGKEPGSNGLAFDSEGRLVFCQHGNRRISRLERDGSVTALVERYEGKRINSPNDVVIKSNGDLYFTDPPFGLPKSFDDPQKETPWQGVYRRSTDGKLTLLTKELKGPNGIAFSPDEKVLHVSDYTNMKWWNFDVHADGTLGNGRVLHDAAKYKSKPGGPDGLKVDVHDNLFATGPGGIYIIAPDGTYLGGFEFGVPIGNCAWGEDGSTLFIAANHEVYRIRLTTKGAGFAP
jgi:gluconolactonase